MPSIYFITGVSSGLGYSLALRAASAGHIVLGTVRSRTKSAKIVSELEKNGVNITELDVTDAAGCQNEINKSAKQYGGIDVLINNAGYSLIGALESFSDEECHDQMETNFHGPLRLIKATLPFMREKKSGTIVNITSIAGIDALPTCSLYSGSKFALEGLSESLAREVVTFGIRVLLVEPGAFRTQFIGAMQFPQETMADIYPVVKEGIEHFEAYDGKQPGDPEKGAARIIEAIDGSGMAGALTGKVLRLPLGKDCLERYKQKVERLQADLEASWTVGESTGYA